MSCLPDSPGFGAKDSGSVRKRHPLPHPWNLNPGPMPAPPPRSYHGATQHSPRRFPFTFGASSNCSVPLLGAAGKLTSASPAPRAPVATLRGAWASGACVGSGIQPRAWGSTRLLV